jgi:hypothetical protein
MTDIVTTLPVAWLYQHGETGRTRIVMPDQVFTNGPGQWLLVSPLYATPPDHRKAMRLALEALEICADETSSGLPLPAIDALRAALGEA